MTTDNGLPRARAGSKPTRRSILAAPAVATAATWLPAGRAGSRAAPAAGAHERVRLGWIGCGIRSRVGLPAFTSHPDVRVPALCDVHRPRAEITRRIAGGAADIYGDYRSLLDRTDIDAIVIATPEHWKHLVTVHALQAGKDVYVEKPLALTIAEGRAMVKAARKAGRIAMFGTQQRSMECYREAIDFIHSGKLGRISEVRSWNFENLAPRGYGRPPDSPPPPGLDWDMWLGPAPEAAYNPNRYSQFHFFWDYGGGWQCDWGVHMFDVVHWAMKVDAPRAVAAVGGRFARDDNTEHPDTFEALFEYAGFIALYSYRHGNGRLFEDMWYGNAFYGENGTLAINRDAWRVYPERVDSHDPGPGMRMAELKRPGTPVEGPHQHRFIDAVKSRRQPETDLEMGHRSTIPGHLANISFRTGRRLEWDSDRQVITNDTDANRLLKPTYRKPWTFDA
jgi:predicted dehydrogenase